MFPYKTTDIISLEATQRTFTSKIMNTQYYNCWQRLCIERLLTTKDEGEMYDPLRPVGVLCC